MQQNLCSGSLNIRLLPLTHAQRATVKVSAGLSTYHSTLSLHSSSGDIPSAATEIEGVGTAASWAWYWGFPPTYPLGVSEQMLGCPGPLQAWP